MMRCPVNLIIQTNLTGTFCSMLSHYVTLFHIVYLLSGHCCPHLRVPFWVSIAWPQHRYRDIASHDVTWKRDRENKKEDKRSEVAMWKWQIESMGVRVGGVSAATWVRSGRNRNNGLTLGLSGVSNCQAYEYQNVQQREKKIHPIHQIYILPLRFTSLT